MAPFLGWGCGGAPARGVMARPVSPKPSIRRLCCAHRRTLRSSACDVCRSTFPAVLSCTRHARLCAAVDIERRPLSLCKLIMLIRRLRRVPPRGRWILWFWSSRPLWSLVPLLSHGFCVAHRRTLSHPSFLRSVGACAAEDSRTLLLHSPVGSNLEGNPRRACCSRRQSRQCCQSRLCRSHRRQISWS